MKSYINSKNPEFTRNIWLEMTTGRLMAVPVILIMIFFAIFSFAATAETAMNSVRLFSILIFMLLGVLYGTKLATESIVGEMNDKTWDNQRLTLISPSAMACGKLFGSTSFAWYGALLSLVMYVISSFYSDDVWMNIRFGIWLVLFTVLTHELALLASLLGIRKNRDRQKISWFFYYLVAVGISYYIQGMVYIIFFTTSLTKLRDELFSISWYFINFNIIDFLIISTIIYIIFAFTGLKNLIKSEFNIRNKSFAWLFFLVFIVVYFFGFGISFFNSGSSHTMFGSNDSPGSMFNVWLGLLMAYIVIELFVYYLIFNEKNNSLVLLKIGQLISKKNIRELNYEAPLWVTTLLISFVLVILFQISSIVMFSQHYELLEPTIKELWFLMPTTLFLYMMRDILILLFFNMNKSFKKPEIATLITLFLLYNIMPLITYVSGFVANTYFSPFGTGWKSILSILIQLAIIFFLFRNAYKNSIKTDVIT